MLRARSLVTVDDGLTAAGLLLLGEHPQLSLPHALVRVLRYQADETGVGSRQTMAAGGDRRLEGAIPTSSMPLSRSSTSGVRVVGP